MSYLPSYEEMTQDSEESSLTWLFALEKYIDKSCIGVVKMGDFLDEKEREPACLEISDADGATMMI